jgi:hypothetical protein
MSRLRVANSSVAETEEVIGKDGFLRRHDRFGLYRFAGGLPDRDRRLMHLPDERRKMLKCNIIVGNMSRYDCRGQVYNAVLQGTGLGWKPATIPTCAPTICCSAGLLLSQSLGQVVDRNSHCDRQRAGKFFRDQ